LIGLIDKVHYTGEFVGDKHGQGGKRSKYEVSMDSFSFNLQSIVTVMTDLPIDFGGRTC
jgi:hypothetical protein